jgi:hypothetical protein
MHKTYSLRFNIHVVQTELVSYVLVQFGCPKRQYFANGVVIYYYLKLKISKAHVHWRNHYSW